MGFKHYILVLGYFNVNVFWSQFSTFPVFFGPQLSIQEQAQQVNPASFSNKGRASLLCQGAIVAQLPGLQQLSINLAIPRQRLSLHQHFSIRGIQSFQNLNYMSSVGLALSPELKVGVGLGFQTFFQDGYYGTSWSALLKAGLQYQFDLRQYFGLTFELNAPFDQAALKWAYANQMSSELICFSHVLWCQSLPPQFYFGLAQKLNNYQLICIAALQPQIFGIALEKKGQQVLWTFGLQWQNRVGLGLHWSLQLSKK